VTLRAEEDRLQSLITTLIQLEDAIPAPHALVTELRADFKNTRDQLGSEVRLVRTYLSALQDVLAHKRERPATPADMSEVTPQSDVASAAKGLAQTIEAANAAIAAHNLVVENFAKHKEEAEFAIRKHFIADCREEYANYARELDDAKKKFATANEEFDQLTNTANQLRQQIKEHGPAAGTINKLIASYLGHQELTIHPVEQGYQLQRHGQPIRGVPSEGEKTAIAISYFLSSIEAEGRRLKDLIVVVDDPVSSLDSKALNYACALVRSRLTGAGQLFVLTHNLQCMNEFRKAWKRWAKPPEGNDPTATFLFIDVAIPVGQNRRSSTVIPMSRLLREYDSEYHFLFSHILKFIQDPDAYYDHDYMLPNVLRRVLDVFLAFKCPGPGLPTQIQKLCTDYPALDRDRLAALERLAQVESHSDNLDDLLSFSSMTVEETRAAACALIDMMELVDSNHLANLRRLCR
jgi:wobble nucleotide-excising tRNase